MKKIVTIILSSASIFINAQDLTSKKGEPILPEAKDWSIGIDAVAAVNYINSFTIKNNKAVQKTNALPVIQTITGKYFKTANTAYRTALSIGVTNYKIRNRVMDRVAASNTVAVYPAAVAQKENIWSKTISSFGVSFGIEKRKGKTRLQGIYGYEAGIYIQSSKDKFTYGNALSTSNTTPVLVDTTADAMNSPIFGTADNISTNASSIIQGVTDYARMKERKNGTSVSFGLRGFIGAEYFVLPKISIGGEFGFGLGLTTSGRSTTKWESIGSNGGVKSTNTTTEDGGKNGNIKFTTDNTNSMWGMSGSMRLHLYF
jgi:hypothetical protein